MKLALGRSKVMSLGLGHRVDVGALVWGKRDINYALVI